VQRVAAVAVVHVVHGGQSVGVVLAVRRVVVHGVLAAAAAQVPARQLRRVRVRLAVCAKYVLAVNDIHRLQVMFYV